MQAVRETHLPESRYLHVESLDSGQMLTQMIFGALSFHDGQPIQYSLLKGVVRNNHGRQGKKKKKNDRAKELAREMAFSIPSI